jgi:two-component system, response regulator
MWREAPRFREAHEEHRGAKAPCAGRAIVTAIDILVVEDDPDDVAWMLRALRRYHLANPIAVMHDGAEALEYLFGTGAYAHHCMVDRPVVVLLDLKRPTMDRLEVLRRLKTDPRTQATPVVVLLSSHEEREVVERHGLQADSYLIKPVGWAQFAMMVRQLGLSWLVLARPSGPSPMPAVSPGIRANGGG